VDSANVLARGFLLDNPAISSLLSSATVYATTLAGYAEITEDINIQKRNGDLATIPILEEALTHGKKIRVATKEKEAEIRALIRQARYVTTDPEKDDLEVINEARETIDVAITLGIDVPPAIGSKFFALSTERLHTNERDERFLGYFPSQEAAIAGLAEWVTKRHFRLQAPGVEGFSGDFYGGLLVQGGAVLKRNGKLATNEEIIESYFGSGGTTYHIDEKEIVGTPIEEEGSLRTVRDCQHFDERDSSDV
jgi:hypothetical protein